MEIKSQKVTTDTRLVRWVMESFAELFERGLGPLDGDCGWHYSYDCVVAYVNDEIGGGHPFQSYREATVPDADPRLCAAGLPPKGCLYCALGCAERRS